MVFGAWRSLGTLGLDDWSKTDDQSSNLVRGSRVIDAPEGIMGNRWRRRGAPRLREVPEELR